MCTHTTSVRTWARSHSRRHTARPPPATRGWATGEGCSADPATAPLCVRQGGELSGGSGPHGPAPCGRGPCAPTVPGARPSGGCGSLRSAGKLGPRRSRPPVAGPDSSAALKMDSDHFRRCHWAAIHVMVKIARVAGPPEHSCDPAPCPASLSELRF